MTFALAPYPISGSFRERLAVDEVAVLPELRRLSPQELLRRLRSLRGTCLIALEDPASEPLLPILELVAALTGASRIEIVRGDERERTSRARGASHGLQLAAASIHAQLDLRRAEREVGALLRADRPNAPVALDNVLYLNPNLWFGVTAGGSVAHVAGVVNALARRGLHVRLATAPAPIGIDPGVNVTRLRAPARYALPVESNLYRFGRSVPAQLAGLPRPTLVYQRHSVGSYAGALLARRYGVPLVLEYNGSEVWIARSWGRPLHSERLAMAAEDASLRHAFRVVTISQALADELVTRGVERDRIVWYPNGVDPAVFEPARFDVQETRALRARYGIPDDALVVTFVGTFGQWHGVEILARAARAQADWARARGVRYLFVGDGLRMPDVRRELEGAHDIAVLAGLVPQAEAPLHLAASDILVSPHVPNADGSPFFGSPTKLFEYMAAGKPIIASDLDQVGEVVRGAGVLVAPGDVDALGAAITELATDPVWRSALGGSARQRVLERYTWDHHVAAILDALR